MRKISGEGPRNAKIVFIGEAPGKEEEKLGRPFVGRAGKFLNKILNSIGIERKKCYITNVVKFRPTRVVSGKIRDRAPTRREIERALPALKKELSVMKPNVIVLLGRTAWSAFGISGRGKIVRKGRAAFLPTYHPAAAMRNRKLRKLFVADLRKAKIFE
jgi:DNA polymerase